MIAELLALNQKADGSAPLVLLTMKYHILWQERAPGETTSLQKTATKFWILANLGVGILSDVDLLLHFNYFTRIQYKC